MQFLCQNGVKMTSDHAQNVRIVIISDPEQKILVDQKFFISKKMDFIL